MGPMKQRIVGFAVLTFLALIILPWLISSHQTAFFQNIKPEKRKVELEDSSEKLEEAHAHAIQPIADNLGEQTVVKNEQQTPAPNNDMVEQQGAKQSELTPPPAEMKPATLNHIQNNIVHTQVTTPSLRQGQTTLAERPSPVAVATDVEDTITLPDYHLGKMAVKKPRQYFQNHPKSGDSAIQLGTFSNKANVDKLVRDLKAKGYPVYVKTSVKAEGKTISRVYVGPTSKQSAAEMILRIDRLFHIHGVLVKSTL